MRSHDSGRIRFCALDVRQLLVVAALFVTAMPGRAQHQFEELFGQAIPADDAERHAALAFGDVDGDGDLDLVCGNWGQNRLFLNDGGGVFTDATAASLPQDDDLTEACALGDVDGDGDLDLVYGGFADRLYVNDGTGVFTDETATRMPAVTTPLGTTTLVFGDVDGDGDLDLFHVGTRNPSPFALYLNDGAGRFAVAAGAFPSNEFPSGLALGDLDADGDLDLVVWSAGLIRLYANDGTGTYADVTAGRLPAVQGDTAELGDVDADGDLDLVLGQVNSALLYLNDGTGAFADVSASRMPAIAGSGPARDLAFVDIDRDGDLDLFLTRAGPTGPGQIRLFQNDGAGTFADVTSQRVPIGATPSASIAVGDVDGDGDLDACFVGNRYWPSDPNRLYLNDGRGFFADASATRVPVDFGGGALALGDVDDDGDLDLVCTSYQNDPYQYPYQNRLLLNDGFARYTDATAARMPASTYFATLDLALGDVDSDGDLDLVCGHAFNDRLYLNHGSGTFVDATTGRLPRDVDTTRSCVLGDIDGDRDLDLICGNVQQDRLYLNDGTGVFTDATTSHLPTDGDITDAVALGDVDSDGDLDLVLASNHPRDRLYLNDGRGVFTDVTATHLPTLPSIGGGSDVALGDVDGDGDLDLVFGGRSNNGDCLFLNDGTGRFTDASGRLPHAVFDSTDFVALGDVDNDGDLDLILNQGLEKRLFLNNGAGFYTDVTTRLPAGLASPYAVALGDVDGDGDLDFVLGNGGYNRIQLYLNLVRQLDAPFLLRAGGRYRLDAFARYGPSALADVAVPYIGFGRASIAVPPLGTLGLDPALMVALPPLVVPQPAGVGSLSFVVPANTTLVGSLVYAQALTVPYPHQAHLTNVVADVVHR